jgi:hypothetical protein
MDVPTGAVGMAMETETHRGEGWEWGRIKSESSIR